jgi:Lamin Tail Domain/FlgD Ig-like domain/CARDB
MIKKFLILFLVSFFPLFAQVDTSLTISEVMFYPASGNNEFIEIYNTSSSNTIDLDSFKIIYSTSNPDIIIGTNEGTLLPPESFAVVLEGDYTFGSGIYDGIIPPEALVLKISDNAFGTTGMANTSDRPIWLLNSANDTLETYTYSANNNQTFSDEKINLIKDNSSSNWANSLVQNGTPGFQNSVTPVQFDLALSSLTFSPALLFEGDDVTITTKVQNLGSDIASNYSIEIYNDTNFDSVADPGELIFSQNYFNLDSGDSISVNTVMNSLSAGNYQIIAKAVFALDENLSNNNKIKSFVVNPPGNNYNDIVIDEIMYAPSTGEPEWVELFNRSASPINLKHWTISDNSTSVEIASSDILIPSEDYIVLTKDSSILNFYDVGSEIVKVNIPPLNNTGDAVVIKDTLGVIIDSVLYSPDWGGNSGGKSLERISPDQNSNDETNWGTSVNPFKATPGRINSLTQKDFDLVADDISFNPQYPLSGDNISVSARIKNAGLNSAAYSIQLFEDTNLDSIPDVLLETLTGVNLTAGDSSLNTFSYFIQNIQSKRGFEINVIYSSDEDTTNNRFYKTIEPGFPPNSIVVNEIMYTPAGGEPEWIELYNKSGVEINLNGWSISDVFTTPTTVTINEDYLFQPHSYLVISRSQNIYDFHRFIPSDVIVLSIPSLNNDVDGVVLKDNRGLAIDSVLYSSQWGGTNGYSLERISIDAESNLSANWNSSIDIEQSTPGRINSITPKQFDISVAEMNFNPRFPVPGEDVFITTKIKNNGSSAANNFSVEFYIDTDSNQVVDQLLSSQTNLSLNSGDSVSITSSNAIQNLNSKILAAVRVIYSDDEDTLNNYVEKSVEPGFAQNIVLINEVMYNPAEGEPEWIELVNVSNEEINLKNWSVSDVLSTPTKNFISTNDLLLEPDEYLIIAKDTSFFNIHPNVTAKTKFVNFGSLGNSADGVIIYDFRDGIIDSLFYRSSWGGKKGYSLERISFEEATNDSTNWTTSLSTFGSTPGEPNSIGNVLPGKRNDLVINEIMFDPETDNSEFVEFYNRGGKSIEIGGWKIEDENGNSYRLSEISKQITDKSYFILAADSSIFKNYHFDENSFVNIVNVSSLGLVNTGELILLKDVRGNLIDSVFYSDKWHNKNFASTRNISLERINPELNANDPLNWSSSVDVSGATPSKQNSIYTENLNKSANLTVSPNPFSPDNDGFEDFTIINYNLTQAISQVRIKIFDSKGRLVRTLLNNQPSASTGSVIFDGRDDDGNALRIGIYIIFLEALNDNSGVVETMKSVVVVARKL